MLYNFFFLKKIVCYTIANQGIEHEFGAQYLAAAFHRIIAVCMAVPFQVPKVAFHFRMYEMLAA